MGTLEQLKRSAELGPRPMTDAEEHAAVARRDREDAERAAYAKEALERLANQVNNVAAKRAEILPAGTGERRATPPMERYVATMVNELRASGLQEYVEIGWKASEFCAEQVGKYGEQLLFRVASDLIDRLKVHVAAMRAAKAALVGPVPAVPTFTPKTAALPVPDVEDGRYALRGDDGVVRFYRVAHSKKSGRAYVKIQASDELHYVEPSRGGREVLAKIAEAPEAAQVLYGRELGECYDCGRTLTDELSRSLGIGPVCRTKGGE